MTSASEGLIERNDGLDLFVALVDERELAVEQRHLRVERITRGRGVSVHRSDCTSLGHTPEDLERMIEVSWDEASSESFHVGIDIQAYDRSGILMEVMAVLSELKITITNMNAKVLENTKNVMINIVVEIRDISQLDFVMTKLRRIREVYTVQRSKGGA